jgi:DNA-binding GntR family transcriptional regulator
VHKNGAVEIHYPSLSERVYEFLSNQIIEGKIRYGERLNTKQLSQKLNVSTMPVRDALKKLELESIVRIKPRSNCVVTVPTKKSILDAFEMRQLLEMRAVERILSSPERTDLTRLWEITRHMEDIVQEKRAEVRLPRYIQLDRLFHTELCALSKNEYLMKFYREVSLHLNMTFIYRIGTQPDVSGTSPDHSRLVGLLSESSRQALTLLGQHLENSRRNIIQGELYRSLD